LYPPSNKVNTLNETHFKKEEKRNKKTKQKKSTAKKQVKKYKP
jgi:hypothetical protein